MIITQAKQRRSFVGSMNVDDDFVDAIKSICVDNTIFCAVFGAVGYIANPTIRRFDASGKRYEESDQLDGALHCVSLNGNISLQERQTIVTAHVVGTLHQGDKHTLISGELLGGKVIAVEFHLETMDDIRLYRAEDKRTGLDSWLHMEFGTSTSAPVLGPAVASPSKAAANVGTVDEQPGDYEIQPGDIFNHPTLGRCEVTGSEGDERLTVKLESGREVELHRRLLEVIPMGKEGERTIYKAVIKRRRR